MAHRGTSRHKPVDGLRKGEWEIAKVPHADAARLVRDHHYSRSTANTSTYAHGLFRRDEATGPILGPIRGAALWIPPTRRAAESIAGEDWRRVLVLTRLCVDPDCPTNAATFLMAGSIRLLDRELWPWLLTYADTGRGHTGAIYRATGWVEVGEVPAGDTWLGPAGEQRGRKRGGVTLTVMQMRAAGFTRQPAMPKVKYVLPPPVRRVARDEPDTEAVG